MLWIGMVIVGTIALAILALPSLLGNQNSEDVPRQDYDAAVYKDQLAEVDRDVERGLISETEAETARVEIQRRLLNAVDANTEQKYLVGEGRNYLVPTLALMALIGAVVLYLELGSPTVPDFPYASRSDLSDPSITGEAAPDMDEAISQLEVRLRDNPDDPEGWMMLGRTYFALERYVEAQKAFLQLYELTGDIQAKAEYAEALVMGSNAQVIPEALEIFDEVLRADPYDPKARFYFGVGAAQQGNLEGAIQIWTDLLHLSAPDAPWIAIVQQQIQAAAAEAGIDPSTLKPTEMAVKLAETAGIQSGGMSAPVAPGPSQEDIDNAQQMTADEQMEMIRSMVQRLADRLADNPNDREGWLRLAQAYEVLGETEKAKEARQRAAQTEP